jgi:hypothetical protein
MKKTKFEKNSKTIKNIKKLQIERNFNNSKKKGNQIIQGRMCEIELDNTRREMKR